MTYEAYITPPRTSQEFFVEYEIHDVNDITIDSVSVKTSSGEYTNINPEGFIVDVGPAALKPVYMMLDDYILQYCLEETACRYEQDRYEQEYIDMQRDMQGRI